MRNEFDCNSQHSCFVHTQQPRTLALCKNVPRVFSCRGFTVQLEYLSLAIGTLACEATQHTCSSRVNDEFLGEFEPWTEIRRCVALFADRKRTRLNSSH